MLKFQIVVLTLVLCVTGCEKISGAEKDLAIANQALNEKLIGLESRILTLEIEKLENDRSTAFFDPSSVGYARIDTLSGSFLVAMTSLKEYADGYKMSLNIGNPNFATYSSVLVKASWGPRFDRSGKMTYEQWEKDRQNSQVTLTKKILPGSWNPVSVVLSPATKEEVGSIKISLETNQVLLSR